MPRKRQPATPETKRVNSKIPQALKDRVEKIERRLLHRGSRGNLSAVMRHPQHLMISYDIVRRELTQQQIADKYGLPKHNIIRHAKRLRDVAKDYSEAKNEEHVKSLDEMVEWHNAASREAYGLAKQGGEDGKPHFSAMNDFLSQAARSIELAGDLRNVGIGANREATRAQGLTLIQNMVALPKIGDGVPGQVIDNEVIDEDPVLQRRREIGRKHLDETLRPAIRRYHGIEEDSGAD